MNKEKGGYGKEVSLHDKAREQKNTNQTHC
jgi:hypothetical protein